MKRFNKSHDIGGARGYRKMVKFGGVKRQPAPMRLNIHRKDAERLAWLCNDRPRRDAQTGTAALGAIPIFELHKLWQFWTSDFSPDEYLITAALRETRLYLRIMALNRIDY
jgi:hypothetical protein